MSFVAIVSTITIYVMIYGITSVLYNGCFLGLFGDHIFELTNFNVDVQSNFMLKCFKYYYLLIVIVYIKCVNELSCGLRGGGCQID